VCVCVCPVAEKAISESRESNQALAGLLSANFGLSVCPETLGVFSITWGYHQTTMGAAIEIAWLYLLSTRITVACHAASH
jgi:hypothetical protein